MKRMTVIALVIISVGCVSATGGDIQYRNAKWGSSKEDVKKLVRPVADVSEEDSIVCNEKLFGYDIKTMYSFTFDKLQSVIIEFPGITKEYNSNFTVIRNAFVSNYGKPTTEKEDSRMKSCSWKKQGGELSMFLRTTENGYRFFISFDHVSK